MTIQIKDYPITQDLVEKGFIFRMEETEFIISSQDKVKEKTKDWKYINVYEEDILLYDGLFFSGEKNGFGIEYYPEKGYYKGNFSKGKRNGYGELYYKFWHYD